MKDKLKKIFFLLVLYVFLFNPPLRILLGNIDLGYVLIIISFLLMIKKSGVLQMHISIFEKELILFLIVLFYVIIRSGIQGDTITIIKHILGVSKVFFVIPFILYYAKKVGLDNEHRLIRSLLIVSSLAACITILCIYNPSFDSFVREKIIQYNEDDYLMNASYRGFGIASGLTSYYGYIQGTIMALGVLYIKENKWFLPFLPLVFLSALVNARTGVLISIWGLIVFALSKNSKLIIPLVSMFIIFIISLENIMSFFNFSDYTMAWILDFQDEMGGFYSSGDIGQSRTLSRLFGEMFILPQTFTEWILGKGVSLFRTGYGQAHSDMGWVLQLNYGGIIYLIPLYTIIITIAKRMLRNNLKLFSCFFIGTIVIINTKSSFYPGNGEFFFLMLLYCFFIIKEEFSKKQMRNNININSRI